MSTLNVNDTLDPREEHTEPSWSVINRIWFVLGYAWAVLMTIFFAFAFVIARLVTRDPNVFRYWASGWGKALMLGFGVRTRVEIRADLDCSSSYVFVANHQNMLDIPLLASVLPCSFGFVAKAELENWPFLGMALRMSPSVFVASGDPRRSLESLKKAGREIRAGRSVMIFPEGMRTYGPEVAPFKKSAFVLAAEAEVPIVPITIIDAYRLANEKVFAAKPGAVRVVVHVPIPVEGKSRSELVRIMDRVREVIRSELPETSVSGVASAN